MSDIKLFRLSAGKATELQGDASDLEKPRVIIKYKRALNENVINQGMCYPCSFPIGPELHFQEEAKSD